MAGLPFLLFFAPFLEDARFQILEDASYLELKVLKHSEGGGEGRSETLVFDDRQQLANLQILSKQHNFVCLLPCFWKHSLIKKKDPLVFARMILDGSLIFEGEF